MSADEIRNQKALALLEFREASDNLHSLEKEKAALAKDLRQLAVELENEAALDHPEAYAHLTAEAAFTLLGRLAAARNQYHAAEEKKKQFGL